LFSIRKDKKQITKKVETFLTGAGFSGTTIRRIVPFSGPAIDGMLYASAIRDDQTIGVSDEILAKQLSIFQPVSVYLIESSNGTDSFEHGFILKEDGEVHEWIFRQSGTDFTKAIDAARSLLFKAYQNEELDYVVTHSPSWVITSKNHTIRGVYLGNHRKEGKEEIGEDPIDAEVEKFIEPGQVLTDRAFTDTFAKSYSCRNQ
jgi:hypothetical protein